MTNQVNEYESLREDTLKLYKFLEKVLSTKGKVLIAPDNLPSNQAKGYAEGSKDALKRVTDMAEFVKASLLNDYEDSVLHDRAKN